MVPSSPVRVVLQILLIIASIAAGVWLLRRLAAVVLVLVLAALFAYVIAPLVQMAERPVRIAGRSRRLSRGMAIAVVYLLMAGALSTGGALLLPTATRQVDEMASRAPAYAQSIFAWQHGWSRYYERLRIPPALRRAIDQSVATVSADAVASARESVLALAGALSGLPWLILIPIAGFFLLKDAARFRRTIVLALPHRVRLRGHRLFEELNAAMAAYMRAQLLACVLVGTVCGLGFAVLGIPYPVLLGVLAGLLEFIPFVGPLLLAIVAVAVAALHAPKLALWAAGFLGVFRVVEDYVIYPRLMRRGLHLHPLAVILAVLAGAELGGIVGMFLAVPAVAIASVVFRHWLDWRTADAAVDASPLRSSAGMLADPAQKAS
jgi:predicted PurR-regulated permease PerM